MMHTHGGYYTHAPPLTFDEAIYWPNPALYSEWQISWYVLRDAELDVRARVDEMLRIASAREVAKQYPDWLRYTTERSERTDDRIITVRHTLCEQPGYQKIELFRAPPEWMTFRKLDEAHNVVELPLRRLMYYGVRARGALHDGTLYVVL